MTKDELQIQLSKLNKKTSDLEQKLKIAEENVETHKRASYDQNKLVKETILEKDSIKINHEKLTTAYNELVQLFDDYVQVSRNSLQQLQGLTKASVMLEKHITQKIENFNKGV